MRLSNVIPSLAAGLMVCLAWQASAGPVYRWVDTEGNVHFGSERPRGVEAEEMRLQTSQPTQPAEAASSAGRPASGEEARGDAAETVEKAPPALSPEQQAAEKKMNEANCEISRENLNVLENMSRRVYAKNAEGEMARLTPDEVAARRKETLADIEKFCR